MAPVLTVTDLNVRFALHHSTVTAVNDLSFTLDAGETLAVVGESGSGKSQAFMALMGLLATPDGPSVFAAPPLPLHLHQTVEDPPQLVGDAPAIGAELAVPGELAAGRGRLARGRGHRGNLHIEVADVADRIAVMVTYHLGQIGLVAWLV